MKPYVGEAYCVKCKDKVVFTGVREITNGREFAKGTCPHCGTKVTRILGKIIPPTKVFVCQEFIEYEGACGEYVAFLDEDLAKKYCSDSNKEAKKQWGKGNMPYEWMYTEVEVRTE